MGEDLPLPEDSGINDILFGDMAKINAMSTAELNKKAKEIENQYAGQKNQAEIDYKNALMRSQNIQNQYDPDRLRLANENQMNVNKMYMPNMQSEINSRNALTRSTNQKTDNPLLGGTGVGSNEANLAQIERQFGKNSPQYAMAMQDYQQNAANEKAKASYYQMGGSRGAGVDQKALAGFSSQLAVDHPEWSPAQVNDAANSYLSGSDTFSTGEKLPPLQGQADQLKTIMEKKRSTAAIQNQSANMSVLASDLNGIDITPVAKFAGPAGKAEYAKNLTAMATGGPVSEDFRDYQAFKNVTSNFAMDALRKGFGTSVVPGYVYATLGKASNPAASWWNDPEQVNKEWNATKKWINDNAGKYKTLAIKGVGADIENPPAAPDKTSSSKIPTKEEAIAELRKRGRIK